MVRLIQFVGERLFIVLMLGFLFLFSADVFAGSFASGDSLLNETLLMKDDSAKVKKLINLAHKKINDNEMQEAIRIAQLSRVLSENIGYRFGEQMSYTAIGRCYSRLGDHENGLKHYTNANGIAIELNRSVANSFGNIGLAYQHLGNLAEALAFQLKALNIYENENDSLGMAKIYQYLGYLLTEQDKTAESIVYYKKSLAIFEINQKNSEVLSVLRLMGVAYRESGNLDSSLFFLNKAYELVKVNGSRRDQSDIFQTLASTHRVLCEFAADSNIAKYHFNESLRLNQQCLKWAEESGNENRIAKLYGNMGSLYSCRLQYTLAREKYNAALNLLLKSSDKADLRAIYLNLSDLDSLMAADQHFSLEERLQFARSSLVNTKLAEALRYEIINEESTHKLAELNTKYETERKDKEILLLNKEKDLQKVMLKEQLSTLLISNLRQQKDEQQIELLRKIGDVKLFELNAAQQEIEAQIMKSKVKENALVIAEKDMALKEKELSKEKWLRGSILTGSFAIFFVGLLLFNRYKLKKQLEHQQILINQRKSISADLHDDVGSTLSSISIYSEAIKIN
ncbi:MAG: tetratricopeptide repeat protein [Bacteroidetes bacterium]|nr:tetratricopeptide repeat protein [Bacteroidota bacterium]